MGPELSIADLRDAELGSVMISPDSFAAFDELSREFSILDFVNHCAGIDAAILYPRLYAGGLYEQENPIQDALVSEGVLANVVDRRLAPASSRDEAESWVTSSLARYPAVILTLIKQGLVTINMPAEDAPILSSALAQLLSTAQALSIEERLPIPVLPAATESIIWRSHPIFRREDTTIQQAATSLGHVYLKMQQTLESLRRDLTGPGLTVPPLAMEAMDRASRPEQLGEVVLELRERYSKVRARFQELDDLLRSGEASLTDKLRAKAKIEKSINSLIGKSGKSANEPIVSYVNVVRGLSETAPIEKLLDGLQEGDIAISKVVARIVAALPDLRIRLQLRALHGTKRTYMDMSDSGLHRLAEKHFNSTITPRHISQLTGFQSLVQSMMNTADKFFSPASQSSNAE